MNNREALLAFSLSFDYLRDKGNNNEEYILDLSKFYVGLLRSLKITLTINIVFSLVVYLFFRSSFDFGIGYTVLLSTILTLVLAFALSNQIDFDKADYQNKLSELASLEKSRKTKLIWKYNLPLMVLVFTNLIPIFVLGILLYS